MFKTFKIETKHEKTRELSYIEMELALDEKVVKLGGDNEPAARLLIETDPIGDTVVVDCRAPEHYKKMRTMFEEYYSKNAESENLLPGGIGLFWDSFRASGFWWARLEEMMLQDNLLGLSDEELVSYARMRVAEVRFQIKYDLVKDKKEAKMLVAWLIDCYLPEIEREKEDFFYYEEMA